MSGQRFWGLFRDVAGPAGNFFRRCFVYSYCPLSFMNATGRNITPPELKVYRPNITIAFLSKRSLEGMARVFSWRSPNFDVFLDFVR